MRKSVIYVCAVVLLASCASLPAPTGNESSLVVGSFVLDFPDGFFDLAPMTLDSQVKLTFRDLSNNETQTVYTKKGGYYSFAGVPGHTYRFEEFGAMVQRGSGNYDIGTNRMGLDFAVQPGKVVYLGHLTVVYKAPEQLQQVGRRESWDYDTDLDYKLKPEGAREYITSVEDDSPWLTYEVVPTRLHSPVAE